jgi:hypothetical protein
MSVRRVRPFIARIKVHTDRTVHLGKYESLMVGVSLEAEPNPALTDDENIEELIATALGKTNETADSETVDALKKPEK